MSPLTRFVFELSERMGMTAGELRQRMSGDELRRRMVLERVRRKETERR